MRAKYLPPPQFPQGEGKLQFSHWEPKGEGPHQKHIELALGKFMLDGILLDPRGMPQIEVPLDTDANGTLNVSAKNKGAGKEQSITITASSGLSQEEIEQMVSDADRFAEEDERKRQEIQTRNNAENAAYAAEQMLRENADNIPEDLKVKVAAVRSTLQNDDIAHVETTLNDL